MGAPAGNRLYIIVLKDSFAQQLSVMAIGT